MTAAGDPVEPLTDVQNVKRGIRAQAEANRRRLQEKDRLSREICRRLAELPEYAAAATVMLYVDFRSEVRTRQCFTAAWSLGKRTVVPYCIGDQLELFRLESMEELAVGTWGILEPKVELRSLKERKVDISRLDLIAVPGVAFDRHGGRIGHGKGYYDRLLRRVREDIVLVGLAFQCQVFPTVPMQEHDVFMNKVITEKGVYEANLSA